MKAALKWASFRGRNSRRLWAAVCLALFVVLQVFADSPALHKDLHPDANKPGHQCAVTLLLQGRIASGGLVVELVLFVAAICFSAAVLELTAPASFDFRLSPSRAPPLV